MKQLVIILFLMLVSGLAAQHQDKVIFTHGKVEIFVDAPKKTLKGRVTYRLKILQNLDTVFLDAQNLEIETVLLNTKNVTFRNNGKTVTVYNRFRKNRDYTLNISYTAKPKQTIYFIGWDSLSTINQVWTQGQGKYTSHWLPSFDDMREKVEFDLNISFDKNYEVIANGELVDTKETGELKQWVFNMERPMSSYLLAFAIGKYTKKQLSSDRGVPLHLYYYPKDSLFIEPTYRYTQEIFEFLEQEIGVAYPWLKYDQVPVRDFLYAGMENTGTTIFSDNFMVDSIAFKDRNYVNVNAHEMAHQWFGNLVTQTDGHAHWLHEGFATYYALLAEKNIFGEAYYYWKLYDSALRLNEASNNNGGEALTDPKASSLTFYEKGAWALHVLRRQIGDSVYKAGIVRYLEKYKFGNAGIDEFLHEMELAGESDLNVFKKKWLNGTLFPFLEAKDILIAESKDLEQLFKLQEELITTKKEKEHVIWKYFEQSKSMPLKAKLITTYYKSLSEDFIRKAFKTKDLSVRQAIATSIVQIPIGLKHEFESMLKDESYLTLEHILYKLWIYFPDGRLQYLEETKNIIGFPDKNVRILWLTLALLTKDYESQKKEDYYKELSGYTDSSYSFEVRQKAFGMLQEVIGLSDKNLLDLIEATQHHSWQFKQYSRSLVDQLIKEHSIRDRMENLKVKLKGEELRYMNNKLKAE
ncbi:aminopeptidase [Arenibacter sp. H213]|uniref:Aminopeptidase N n=1 Tax=Arenibacter antarcticus TaxID=2040469 RepID=A0ABW5VGV4_9FLAO|nr:M1 family metallopeptidase [Arenibacter sp. H213]MCM4168292.1 aminopeptidase [Arenibacter sp. H213]